MTDALSAPGGAIPSKVEASPRNGAQLLTTRLLGVALDKISKALGDKDDSTACRVRSGEQRCTLAEFCKLVTLADLKIVDVSKVCVDRQAYDSLTYIAQKAMADKDTAKKLIWDEDQG